MVRSQPHAIMAAFSWNLTIASFAHNGHHAQAIALYRQMLSQGDLEPDKFTYLPALSACAGLRYLAGGKEIHLRIVSSVDEALHFDVTLANALLHMYAKCGCLGSVRALFGTMSAHDAVSWNTMISAEASIGCNCSCERVLSLFAQMEMEGVKPDNVTFLCLLHVCTDLPSLQRIREHIKCIGIEPNTALQNALIHAYAKCGSTGESRALFDRMSHRNIVSWNTMITAYVHNGHFKLALELFRLMGITGVNPDRITFLCLLNACYSPAWLEDGRRIHECIMASLIEQEISVQNALINMYCKCDSIKEARIVFDRMLERDTISWNSMLSAYAQKGHIKEVLVLYKEMNSEGVKPDMVSFLFLLSACSESASLRIGRVFHHRIVASGLDSNIAIATAILTMYGKCGSLEKANSVFGKMRARDAIAWNALLAAYTENRLEKEALELFQEMDSESVKPNRVTFLCLLDACAGMASLGNVRAIHKCMIVSGLLESDVVLKTALVSVYGKCGSLEDARSIFDGMHGRQGLISWSAMLAAYAENGHAMEALQLFREMELDGGVKPNTVTFLSLLNSCSHAGMHDEGWQYFSAMSSHYGLTPSLQHYVCMIDLLGRTGCLQEAEAMVKNMPMQIDVAATNSFLGSCQAHGVNARKFDK